MGFNWTTLVGGGDDSLDSPNHADAHVEEREVADEVYGRTGYLVELVEWAPSTVQTPATDSVSFEDVDANLQVTFDVPASGRVLVRLSAYCEFDTFGHTATRLASWAVREDSTVLKAQVVDRERDVDDGGPSPEGMGQRGNASFLIGGLTPGATVTWKWSFAVQDTNVTHRLIVGSGDPVDASDDKVWGPALIEVWAA